MSEAKEVAEKLIEWSNFSSIYMAGAKAHLIWVAISARLKSCPVTKLPLPLPERVFTQPLMPERI